MAKTVKKFKDDDGVWKTLPNGVHIFIKNGESLGQAMSRAGISFNSKQANHNKDVINEFNTRKRLLKEAKDIENSIGKFDSSKSVEQLQKELEDKKEELMLKYNDLYRWKSPEFNEKWDKAKKGFANEKRAINKLNKVGNNIRNDKHVDYATTLEEFRLDSEDPEFLKQMEGRLKSDIDSANNGDMSWDRTWAGNKEETEKVYEAVKYANEFNKQEKLNKVGNHIKIDGYEAPYQEIDRRSPETKEQNEMNSLAAKIAKYEYGSEKYFDNVLNPKHQEGYEMVKDEKPTLQDLRDRYAEINSKVSSITRKKRKKAVGSKLNKTGIR